MVIAASQNYSKSQVLWLQLHPLLARSDCHCIFAVRLTVHCAALQFEIGCRPKSITCCSVYFKSTNQNDLRKFPKDEMRYSGHTKDDNVWQRYALKIKLWRLYYRGIKILQKVQSCTTWNLIVTWRVTKHKIRLYIKYRWRHNCFHFYLRIPLWAFLRTYFEPQLTCNQKTYF